MNDISTTIAFGIGYGFSNPLQDELLENHDYLYDKDVSGDILAEIAEDGYPIGFGEYLALVDNSYTNADEFSELATRLEAEAPVKCIVYGSSATPCFFFAVKSSVTSGGDAELQGWEVDLDGDFKQISEEELARVNEYMTEIGLANWGGVENAGWRALITYHY